ALATVLSGLRFAIEPAKAQAGWLGQLSPERTRRLDLFAWQAGFALAMIAVVFTRGQSNLTTPATLLLATAVLGIVVLSRGELAATYAGGLAWCGAGVYLALVGSRWQGFDNSAERIIAGATGVTVALFGLWAAAGWLRRLGTRAESAWAL